MLCGLLVMLANIERKLLYYESQQFFLASSVNYTKSFFLYIKLSSNEKYLTQTDYAVIYDHCKIRIQNNYLLRICSLQGCVNILGSLSLPA